ncbi:helix-turn-helix transcriptional regulator [Solibacillus sp. FSL H8-0523]|uniref:PadR family transcriptional regulator n=1 Tax=Solibacillus sp. FSL H8-0523 TaxID=2954511 RepID=UPI0031018C72
MSIQIYILSKLMQGDNYPYKLKKELSEPIPFDKMGNLTESKLYYHFDSLTKQGLVEPREIIKEENRPDKQVFAITDKGREQLPLKIYELFEKANKVSDMVVGIVFIRHADKNRIITILEKKIADYYTKQTNLNNMYAQLSENQSLQGNAHYLQSYIHHSIEHEIVWLEKLVEKLQTNII